VFHVGFLNKTLQIMRCVCFSCGKLLVPASSPAVQDIIKNTQGNKKRRLQAIKRLCERVKQCGSARSEGEPEEAIEQGAIPEVKHGGCSRFQPKLRRNPAEGRTLEILAEFDKVNDESQERKMEVGYCACSLLHFALSQFRVLRSTALSVGFELSMLCLTAAP